MIRGQRWTYDAARAESLSATSGFPADWYGGHSRLLMPPPPPENYWLIGAPPELIELEEKKRCDGDLNDSDKLMYYRLRGLNDFYFFSKRICGHNWLRWDLHGALAWAWSAPNGTKTFWGQVWGRFRIAILPRGHLKTTLLTQDYNAWSAIRNPEERILIYTQSDDFAEQILAPIKDLFEGLGTTGPLFLQLYGDRIPAENERGKKYKWDQHNLTLIRKGRYTDPTIKAKGFGGRLAGTHSTKQGIDDMVAEELTRTMMEKRIRSYDGLTPLFHSLALGERRFVGTPWGFLDPLSHAIKYRPSALVARLDWSKKPDLPAEKLTNDDLIYPPIEPIELNGGCNVEEALELKRKNEWFFNCQYKCWPKDPGKAAFQKDWFRYYALRRDKIILLDKEFEPTNEVVDLNTCNIFLLVDPNTGRKPGEHYGADINIARAAKSDFAGFVVVAVDEKNYWYVLYALRWRCSPAELVDKVFELNRVWDLKFTAIETTAAQLIFVTNIRREWENGRPHFILRDWGKVNTGASKLEERIKGLIPLYRNGFVYHRVNENKDAQEGVEALEEELLTYPTPEFDDLMDPLAAALPLVWRPGGASRENLEKVKQDYKDREVLAKLDRGSRKMAQWCWGQQRKRKPDEFWAEG